MYKETLNLPKTDFPMKANLSKKELEILEFWRKERIYERMKEPGQKRKFILHDGPPYANGHIHLGTALNKILKDIIIKSRHHMGYGIEFVPGWDCHGLPIEHNVEKEIEKGRKKDPLEVRRLCKDYAKKYIEIQKQEFIRLGVLGDWENPYLTMDKSYVAEIVRTFGKLYEEGYIYRSKKPIYWCPFCKTALAEAEIEYKDHESDSIYVRFKLKDSSFEKPTYILIWTTTPWTLPANLAVCLHPDEDYIGVDAGSYIIILAEKRFSEIKEKLHLDEKVLFSKKGSELQDLRYSHPLFDKEGKLVVDYFVGMDTGSGCVHIAPGHGIEDYEVGLRYDLSTFSPVDDEGKFTDEAGEFSGLFVFSANGVIKNVLKEKELLLLDEEITHSYPHCWRCKKPVIFRATDQWFISMDFYDLRYRTLSEIDKVKWIPSWGRNRIYGMVLTRPDWCISRQRAWGVPIPIFYCKRCKNPYLNSDIVERIAEIFEKEGTDSWFIKDEKDFLGKDAICPKCGGKEFLKEKDILDVWIDSGCSFRAVQEKKGFFPADLYLEGSDQHRGWFQSSLLLSVATKGKSPYNSVLTHGFVVDREGKKMAKSLGNVIPPQEIIKKYGAEILRLWVASEDFKEDIRISDEILKRTVEAYRRIRNTQRFILGNLFDFNPENDSLPISELLEMDRYILHKLSLLTERVKKAYETYDLHIVVQAIHNFCVSDLSAFYLDVAKERLYIYPKNAKIRRACQTVLYILLDHITKLISPILSFTSEEVWKHLRGYGSVLLERFPEKNRDFYDDILFQKWERLLLVRGEVYKVLEMKRKEGIFGHSLDAEVTISGPKDLMQDIESCKDEFRFALIVSSLILLEDIPDSENPYISSEIEGLKVCARKAKGEKCKRCWLYSEYVGKDEKHKDVCERCAKILLEMGL